MANKDEDIIAQAKARFNLADQALSDSRGDELDDLKFMAASPDNQWQWPADVLATRGAVQGQAINARPCLTINKLPQHVKQITNDQRQNRPSAKVIPVDDKADPDVAEILNGVIRHIEYHSDADVAYDTACENQVTFGEGYFRLLTEYVDEDSFEQDIRIGRIRNSFSVYMDPTMQDPAGSDAKWCLITEDMLKEDFEADYPNATPVSTLLATGIGNRGMDAWITEKTIKVAEYFYFENVDKTLCLLQTPGMRRFNVLKDSEDYKQLMMLGAMPVIGKDGKEVKRQTTIKQVKWCKINGYEVLERADWPGKSIPVIRVVGNEYEVDGQIIISGIVRNAKDAQRMYNYWTSQEAEMLALAPKAPFIGYGGQFEGYEHQWKTANINNWPYLEVNPEVTDHDGRVLPLPQRAPPPLAQNGLLQAKMGAADDIKGTTGQYDSSLGAESTEKSGRAIIARERQSDTGTYHYVDNLAKAIRYATRQILELIPKIYDTQRIARIVGLDGDVEHVKVDPRQPMPVREVKDQATGAVIEKIYNFSIGRYDVMATTGPSYMTKRQEAMNAMAQLLQGNPQLWQVAGDLFIKNMDWPGAQEMAKRFAKTIPPEIMDEGDETPQVVALKKTIEQMQGALQQQAQVMEQMVQSVEAAKVANDEFKADIQAYDANTKRIAEMAKIFAPEGIDAVVRKTVMEIMAAPPLDNGQPAFPN